MGLLWNDELHGSTLDSIYSPPASLLSAKLPGTLKYRKMSPPKKMFRTLSGKDNFEIPFQGKKKKRGLYALP